MKKNYIIPAVRCINLNSEALIATSSIGKSGTLGNENEILSNERESASSSIWGED